MRIDRIANMIGDYSGNNIFLQTEKIAGNVTACIGFVRIEDILKNKDVNKNLSEITPTPS